ncbi:hypothetical protein ABTF33_09665 [Acinetobacter baumannii]
MKTAVFTIKDHSDIGKTINYLHNNYTQANFENKPLVVTITCKQESLSAAQRRLYWLWMTEYGNHRGLDKEEASSFFKYKYLSVIYNRDNVGEYPETFRTMKELKKTGASQYEALRQFVANRISITEATTKQMAEFLKDIEIFCLKDGVKLTCPDDLKYLREQ